MTAPPDFDAAVIVKEWLKSGESLVQLLTVLRGVHATAYAAGEAAGRAAERERAAKIARDFAEHAYRERMDADEQDPVWHLREREVVCREVQRAIEAEPAAPPATPAAEQPTCHETFGTKACVRPAGHDGHHESRSGSCWPLATQPEPARTLAERLKKLAAGVLDDPAESVPLAEAIHEIVVDFARDALRAAIVIERPYVDRSDLAVIVPGEPYERRKPFHSVVREQEQVARDAIIDAAIAAAEKGEVPR